MNLLVNRTIPAAALRYASNLRQPGLHRPIFAPAPRVYALNTTFAQDFVKQNYQPYSSLGKINNLMAVIPSCACCKTGIVCARARAPVHVRVHVQVSVRLLSEASVQDAKLLMRTHTLQVQEIKEEECEDGENQRYLSPAGHFAPNGPE